MPWYVVRLLDVDGGEGEEGEKGESVTNKDRVQLEKKRKREEKKARNKQKKYLNVLSFLGRKMLMESPRTILTVTTINMTTSLRHHHHQQQRGRLSQPLTYLSSPSPKN